MSADETVTSDTAPPGLVKVQQVAKIICNELKEYLRPGVSELELAAEVAVLSERHGSTGLWTPCTTRVGIGTLVAHPDFPMQQRRAEDGDLVIIDVCPTIDGWLGDYCETVTVGESTQNSDLIAQCRDIQARLIEHMRPGMAASELYRFGAAQVRDADLKLLDLLDNFGHSIGREFASDGFIDSQNDAPMWGAWTVEPHVGRLARGAKFEDAIWLSRDGSKTLL